MLRRALANGAAEWRRGPRSTFAELSGLLQGHLLRLSLAGHLRGFPARLAPPLQGCSPEAEHSRHQLL